MREKPLQTSVEDRHQISADFRNPPKEVRKFCRDKHRAAAPFSNRTWMYVSPSAHGWNSARITSISFGRRKRNGQNRVKGAAHPLILLHDPCRKLIPKTKSLKHSDSRKILFCFLDKFFYVEF